MAIIFIGLIKLLQVSAFDADKYTKNRKASFSEPIEQPKAGKNQNNKEIKKEASTELQTPNEKEASFQTNQQETDSTFQVDTESVAFKEVETTEVETARTYSSFSDLKNNYLAPKMASLPAGQLREDIVVRYYRHEQDGDKVYALKDQGYYIHEKEATETMGLGSNILYYGDDVNIEDIQLIAYILLEENLPLKAIEPTQFGWKSTSVEIGTDTLMLEEQTLSIDDIKNFRK
ncbi:hypothetical protein [Ekhidna sp.]